jgi:hypothetical protein
MESPVAQFDQKEDGTQKSRTALLPPAPQDLKIWYRKKSLRWAALSR